MLLRRVLVALLGSDCQPSTVHECRHCGTTVDGETDACPHCGRREIVAYDCS